MAGSMRQRGEGTWQLRVHTGRDAATGRKRYVERTFHGPKRQANKALAALIVEAEHITPRAARQGTFAVLLDEWLEHATPSFSPKTVENTRMYIENAIKPALGAIPAPRIAPADLDRFYRNLLAVGGPRGPYAPATIRRVHGIIRQALTQGVRWGWLSHNPAFDASPPRVPHHSIKPPTPDEVVRLFRAAEEYNPDLATFILLAASSGARRGELVALRWHDVDLDSGTLSIERGVVLVDGELIEQDTKTHQSRRVTLDSGTVNALTGHRDQAVANARAAGAVVSDDSFVFSRTVDGSEPWRPDSVTRDFHVVRDRASVPGVRLHDLRHYVATRLLASGIDVRTVAGRLGHRNPATTLNVYSHFVPEADQDAAEALGQLFGDAMEAADSKSSE